MLDVVSFLHGKKLVHGDIQQGNVLLRPDGVIKSIYINHIVGSSVCLCVCLSALNLQSLKSHDHETWHVGPLSDVDVHGLSGILIFGLVPPQAHAA